jgi:hypothetical protein
LPFSERADIAVVCEDAGAAGALAPVLPELHKRGHHISVWATGRAEELFLRKEIPTRRFADSWRAESPTLVVTGTTAWGERIEAIVVRAARELGIPTLSFVDFWSNYSERFTHKEGFDSLPDVIAVVDERMREDVARACVGARRIVVTGSPLLDEAQRSPQALPRADAPLLFLSQPFEALYGPAGQPNHPLGYTEREVLPVLARAAAAWRFRVRVRAHPREDSEALRALLASLAGAPTLSEGVALEEDVAQSRGVVGMTTMALVQAALMGRPTLSIQLSPAPLALPTFEAGLTALARDEEAVGAWLSALARGELLHKRAPEKAGNVAAGRFADLVEELLAAPPVV